MSNYSPPWDNASEEDLESIELNECFASFPDLATRRFRKVFNELHALKNKVFPSAKMLFVDDRSWRIHYALEKYSSEYRVTIAPNVPEAMRLLVSQNWDVVSLDHDLTGISFEDPDTPTCGMAIVRYIEKTGWPDQLQKPKFHIHSDNLFAAHLMITTLNKIGLSAYYMPISKPKDNMKYDEKGIPK